MADMDVEAIAALRKKRQFKKFMFRGIELDKLLDLSHEVYSISYFNTRLYVKIEHREKPSMFYPLLPSVSFS